MLCAHRGDGHCSHVERRCNRFCADRNSQFTAAPLRLAGGLGRGAGVLSCA